jgi:transcriptional regulator with XRE-family HTH domain
MLNPSELHLARAAYVRSLLAWHGLRQADLAGIIGSGQQSASQKLAGKRRFTTDDLLAIAAALDVEPRYLLTVPTYERGLLTCTKYQPAQVRALLEKYLAVPWKIARFSAAYG